MPDQPEKFRQSSPNPDEKRRLWRTEGGQRYKVDERENDPLSIGRVVTIEMGKEKKLDGGWRITRFEDSGNIVIVQKIENGKTLEHRSSIAVLEGLNPPK